MSLCALVLPLLRSCRMRSQLLEGLRQEMLFMAKHEALGDGLSGEVLLLYMSRVREMAEERQRLAAQFLGQFQAPSLPF